MAAAATVKGAVNAAGGIGLVLDPGQRFRVDLINELDLDTIIHWHWQLPPNAQDGVPGIPMPALTPGETQAYDYVTRSGTHWMHSHIVVQEIELLAAPLIVRSAADVAAHVAADVAADVAAGRQEMVMFLHDFSFRPASTPDGQGMAGMDMGGTGGGMAMDLNDFTFDAYLANDRTLDDPEVFAVDKGGRILVRVINAAAATVFWIDTGTLPGRLVAVDGEPVQPMAGSRFGVAMDQRLDIEVAVPTGGGAFLILALREGAREQTGVILARRALRSSGSRTLRIRTIRCSAQTSCKRVRCAPSPRCRTGPLHRSRC